MLPFRIFELGFSLSDVGLRITSSSESELQSMGIIPESSGLSSSLRKLVKEGMKAAHHFSRHPLLVPSFSAAFFQVSFCLEDPFSPGRCVYKVNVFERETGE
jgi:hypothetical protein